jgi:SNF2 family DNA or RNA helicase
MSKIDLIETDFPQEKIIIFSQWTSMLDIIELPLQENRIAFSRLDGSMSKNSRYR